MHMNQRAWCYKQKPSARIENTLKVHFPETSTVCLSFPHPSYLHKMTHIALCVAVQIVLAWNKVSDTKAN